MLYPIILPNTLVRPVLRLKKPHKFHCRTFRCGVVPPQHSICSRLRSNPAGFKYCAFLRPTFVGVVKAVELLPQQLSVWVLKPGSEIPVSLFPFLDRGNHSRGSQNGVLVISWALGSAQANLRFAHLQLRLKQQPLRSRDGNGNCSRRDSDVELPVSHGLLSVSGMFS